METRSSPSCQTLHSLAERAGIPNYAALPKSVLHQKLQESYDLERLARAESRGAKCKRSKPDSSDYKEKSKDSGTPAPVRKKARMKKSSTSNTFDPIMREPLGKHIYTFVRPNGSCAKFNVESLVDFLLASGDFSDPESRLPFSDEDLKTIDHIVSVIDTNID
jgi:hypothetical protein